MRTIFLNLVLNITLISLLLHSLERRSTYSELKNLRTKAGFIDAFCDALPNVASLWDSLVAPYALTIVMGFIPTFLSLAISSTYQKSQGWVQVKINNWYFWFQIIFILFITGLGGNFEKVIDAVLQNPSQLFTRIANAIIASTHFYLKYLPTQWTSLGMVMTRYIQVSKFKAFSGVKQTEQEAKDCSEPEDQDWYGVGCRFSRVTMQLTLVIVLCTLSPLISLLGAITFILTRIVYSFLFIYAETEKEDLGGWCWYHSLKHCQIAIFIYVILMSIVLLERSDSVVPAAVAWSALLPCIYAFQRFERAFNWQHLPFAALPDESHPAEKQRYVQPELLG